MAIVPKIYREHYERFIRGRAQQVITSASNYEVPLDLLPGQRGEHSEHSPFAEALLKGLGGEADLSKDGIITATELYVYLRDELDKVTDKQTPSFYPLKGHDKGEYLFVLPSFEPNQLEEAPKLGEEDNPYRGLLPFEEEHSTLFFGRKALIKKLQEFVESHVLTVLLGTSSSGKSSLVKAGLIPSLRHSQQWRILAPIRPEESPFTALNNLLAREDLPVTINPSENFDEELQTLAIRAKAWSDANPNVKLLLVIDQFEELVIFCRNNIEREKFLIGLARAIRAFPEQLRIVLTLRSDFEPQFRETALEPYWIRARFIVPAMTQEELREAIVEPAAAKVMYFEPPTLVDLLIDEVIQMPGALPLLSFTLSELYFKYIQSIREGTRSDRAITQADYEELGGVTHSLTQRADVEYYKLVQLDPAYKQIIKYVMLRMVAVDVGELARRRVPMFELEYPPGKNERVQEVTRQFTEARLLVIGQDSEGNPYVEPAHDALVRGWHRLLSWIQENREVLQLQRRLTPAALEWKATQDAGFLWNNSPYLDVVKQVVNSNDNWLNQVETEFVQRSLRKKRLWFL